MLRKKSTLLPFIVVLLSFWGSALAEPNMQENMESLIAQLLNQPESETKSNLEVLTCNDTSVKNQVGYLGIIKGKNAMTVSIVEYQEEPKKAAAALADVCQQLRRQGQTLNSSRILGDEAYWYRNNGCLHLGVRKGCFVLALIQECPGNVNSVFQLADAAVNRLP